MVRLLDRFPLRLLVFLHCFPLFPGQLLQQLLLLLGLPVRPAHIFFGNGASSLSGQRARHTQGNQQHESSNSFHNVSERRILQRSYTEAAPELAHKVLLL
jgi:hypothetical protein